MKLQLTFFVSLVASTSLAQPTDTVFLKREVFQTYPFYHAVFIDSSERFRNELTSFAFDKFDSICYFDELNRFRLLTQHNILRNKIPKRWISLYQLNGRYFLYRPSDFGYHFRFEINDSTTIDFSMEGPEPSKIKSVSFITPYEILIRRYNIWKGETVQIQVVDAAKGIAVFTFGPTKYNKKRSQLLMVDASKAHLFSTIVNYSPNQKVMEFGFDEIDFDSLTR
jgi:hypothetical protein